MKKDFSIHFTIKGQELQSIEKAFDKYQSDTNCHLLDLSEDNSIRLHTCFLPRKTVEEKGFDTALVDFLDTLTDANNINWYNACDTLGMSRLQMLKTIERLGGVAVFIGEIKEGVLDEYNLAKEIGVHIIEIPIL